MNGNEDLEDISERQRQRVEQPTHDCPDRAAMTADLDFLIAELLDARARVLELTQNDEDLRASAEIWCRLYEAAVARANAADAGSRREIPEHLRSLHEALTRVGDLTEVLGRTIRECAACVRDEAAGASVTTLATQLCVRCTRALEALQPRRV
jgi:hypothetical protein